MTTAVILQSNYLPWKGYFQLIDEADVFVFYDDVQYTKNDWRNRNRVKTVNGLVWITVPVLRTGHSDQTIRDAAIRRDDRWRERHRRTIEQAYARAPHIGFLRPILDETFATDWTRLSDLNQFAVRRVCEATGIATPLLDVSAFTMTESDPTRRLVEICRAADADEYLSGPSGASYLRAAEFADAGIRLRFADYRHAEYPQLHPPFEHAVSIVDVLAHCGPDSLRWIRRSA